MDLRVGPIQICIDDLVQLDATFLAEDGGLIHPILGRGGAIYSFLWPLVNDLKRVHQLFLAVMRLQTDQASLLAGA